MRGDVVTLFDGTSLEGWRSSSDGPAQWELGDGAMTVTREDIRTEATHEDAFLHVEFRVPYMPEASGQQRGNSGVFLQGRYELQVLDSEGVTEPDGGDCGAFYRMHPPLENACKPPEQWQAFDVFFRAPRADESGEVAEPARATVLLNDRVIHNNVELPRATGKRIRAGVDPDRTTPGPLLLQCHGQGDRVSFSNIWLRHL